jgi:hypothetical protein
MFGVRSSAELKNHEQIRVFVFRTHRRWIGWNIMGCGGHVRVLSKCWSGATKIWIHIRDH